MHLKVNYKIKDTQTHRHTDTDTHTHTERIVTAEDRHMGKRSQRREQEIEFSLLCLACSKEREQQREET